MAQCTSQCIQNQYYYTFYTNGCTLKWKNYITHSSYQNKLLVTITTCPRERSASAAKFCRLLSGEVTLMRRMRAGLLSTGRDFNSAFSSTNSNRPWYGRRASRQFEIASGWKKEKIQTVDIRPKYNFTFIYQFEREMIIIHFKGPITNKNTSGCICISPF